MHNLQYLSDAMILKTLPNVLPSNAVCDFL